MSILDRLRAFFEGFDRQVEDASRRQAQEALDRARRIEVEFEVGHRGGEFEERDRLPGSPRAHLYGRRR